MMFDTAARESASPSDLDAPTLQFVAFEVLPIANGDLSVSLSSTYLDEENLEFINEDVETVRVTTIDEAVSMIRRSLTDALRAHQRKEH
jgi:hypothetical protein